MKRPCLQGAKAWAVRRWRRLAVIVVAMVVVGTGWILLVNRAAAQREQRRQEARSGREYLCEQVNALPTRIGRALTLSDRIRQITGPTTTVVPAELTPEERAEVERLRREFAEAVDGLGRPIDCRIATTGTTTTTTRP